jgi:hypothetical protein
MISERTTAATRGGSPRAWRQKAFFACVALGMTPGSGGRANTPIADGWCHVTRSEASAASGLLTHRVAPLLNSQPQPQTRLYFARYLPHQGKHDESVQGVRQLEVMRDAALAWRAGAGDAYYDLARRYLLAWAATYQPTLQPIDETHFDTLIDTFAILATQLSSEDRQRIGGWLRNWANGYVEDMQSASDRGNHSGGWSNNWQSHRIKLVTMIAAALADESLFASARALFVRQLLQNIDADGQVIDFTQRDAIHYVVYDLEPLLQAALAARSRGEDWYDERLVKGRSLKRAVAWLLPYVTGEKTHEEFVHSTVPFDHERAEAGLKEYSGPYDPIHAAALFWMAAEFEPSYRDVAEGLHSPEPPFVTLCGQ